MIPSFSRKKALADSWYDTGVKKRKDEILMKIAAVAACTSGIAHTYIAKEKLIRAAESMGHTIHVETQGTIGTEDELTTEQIRKPISFFWLLILPLQEPTGSKERKL